MSNIVERLNALLQTIDKMRTEDDLTTEMSQPFINAWTQLRDIRDTIKDSEIAAIEIGATASSVDKNELLEALDFVKHGGDYGRAWVEIGSGVVHLTMGDSDGDEEEGMTSFKEIEKAVMAVKGVTRVVLGFEWDPDSEEGEDWVNLGDFGQEWYQGVGHPRRKGKKMKGRSL